MESSKMEQIPYTLAIIKPDTAANSDKVNRVLERIHAAGLSVYEQETRTLEKEDIINLFSKHKNRDFFHDIMDYMLSGPCVILLLTMNSGDPIRLWKDIIGPADPIEAKAKKPDSLRAQFGTSLIRNEFYGSDDPRNANRERDIFYLPIPVKEPDFIYDRNLVTLDTLMNFLYPSNLEHPDVCGRLDVFAVYGPVVNYHSVDTGCFCGNCARVGKDHIKNRYGVTAFKGKGKLSDAPRRLLIEEDVKQLEESLCDECRMHCENSSHLTGGRGGQHIMTDIEISQMVLQLNTNELQELLIQTKGSSGKNIMKTVEVLMPPEMQYNRNHIQSLFSPLPTDFFKRMNFSDMQRVILQDRKCRMRYWLSKITKKPIELLSLEVSESPSLPLSIQNTIIKPTFDKELTQYDRTIVDVPKLDSTALKVALAKRLHRDATLIADPKDLNSIDTATNVILLRNYAPGRNGNWNNYATLKGASKLPKEKK